MNPNEQEEVIPLDIRADITDPRIFYTIKSVPKYLNILIKGSHFTYFITTLRESDAILPQLD